MPVNLPTSSEVSHLCYTRSTWQSGWTERSLLQCHQITDALAPSHSSAAFSHVYGTGMMPAIGSRAADNAPTVISKPENLGHYVKVVISNGVTWYGIIVEQDDEQFGTLNGTPSGRLSYTAMGLTFLLERSGRITQTKVKTETSTATIGVAIPFNMGSDGRKSRKRVAGANFEETAKCFTDRIVTEEPKFWKAKDAIQYLIDTFPVKNHAGTATIPLTVSTASKACLDYELPELDYSGLTLWEAIVKLIDRRRGLIMYTTITSGGQIEIVVDSSAHEQILLPSGGVIPANRNQTTFDLDDAVNISKVTLAKSAVQQYDQVEVIGERVGVVFTISPELDDGQVMYDWSDTLEEEYETAAQDDTGYSSLSTADKKAANADFRASDKFAPVFSWWRLASDWDGKGRNKITDGENKPAVITVDEDGTLDITTVAEFWLDGLRFAEFVPMRPGVDYTDNIDVDTDSTDDKQKDFLAPIVFVKLPPVNTSLGAVDDGWVHAERMNVALGTASTKRQHEWAIQLKAREDAPGIIMEVVGAPQHYMAADVFTGDGSFEDVPSAQAVDFRDWIATVYMPLQTFVKAVYPAASAVTSGDVKRLLTIMLPQCHLDYLIEGTVVGVKSGELQTTTGGHLRDDRGRARDVAKLAHRWYGAARQTVQIGWKGLPSGIAVGQLLTSITRDGVEQEVNTVISSLTIDLSGYSTSMQTNFAELDFVGVVA